MSDRSAFKSQLLGENFGTAAHRLRKLVLFRLLEMTGLDICVRCGQRVVSPDDLSMEHQVAWQGAPDPKATFYNLDDIAFSHLKCNIGAAKNTQAGRPQLKLRKVTADGLVWCRLCSQFRPREEFTDNRSRWNGKQSDCCECRKADRNARLAARSLPPITEYGPVV